MIQSKTCPLAILALASLPLLAQAESTQTLPTLYVDAQQTANIRPVTTYESPVSNLEFEPRVDLQSRNMAEAQGDISIRGGIFENTGFRVGSATLIDPQTGHYFAELPIAPEMLTQPDILIGADNALYGFNSTVGTISYGWSQIADGGSFTVGGGDHDLNFQRIHHGLTGQLGESGGWSWGVEAEMSRSESDGTIQFGDHSFDRSSGRIQLVGPNSQTDFFAGYQAKFFGWPGMYTANPASLETENLKTRLFAINHQQQYGESSEIELTAYHRKHKDHFVLTRTNPTLYEAFHETKILSLGIAGRHAFSKSFALKYSAQFTRDEIDSEDFFNGTSLGGLERGKFQSRSYQKVGIIPEYSFHFNSGETITLRAGASFDDTNRDDSELSALFDLTWERYRTNGGIDSIYLSYAESSQVAGYTAIGGGTPNETDPTGNQPRFASNPFLEREISKNLELGLSIKRSDWSFETAIFHRWDDNLADWVYLKTRDSARTATNVDIKNWGFELIGTKNIGQIEALISYTHLNKDEDYSDAEDDAATFYVVPAGTFTGGVSSFYALNYAKHRFTLGAIWTPSEIFQFRIDNEWRENEDNNIRRGSDSALFTHLGLSIYPPQLKNMELFFAVDNAWDDGFEDVPATPGRGDQYSAGLTYIW